MVIFWTINEPTRTPRVKATNERQDNGRGVLHRVSTTPYRQDILIKRAPMSVSTHTRPRGTRYWLQSREACATLYNTSPPTPQPIAQRGSRKYVWAVKNTRSSSRASNIRLCCSKDTTSSTTPP